jgi:hypothetical protein
LADRPEGEVFGCFSEVVWRRAVAFKNIEIWSLEELLRIGNSVKL